MSAEESTRQVPEPARSHPDEGPGPAPEPSAAAVTVFGGQLPLARRYADLLGSTGISHGLMGPRERPRLWDRHLVNCALLGTLVPQGISMIDVGSGAGLPGIVLAVARPDLDVHLVEPLLRRTTWLQSTIDELGLPNVTVHRGRAQEVAVRAPVVTARAVAGLGTLVGWTLPLLEPGGRLLALKGEAAQAELDEAASVLRGLGVTGARVHVVGEGVTDDPIRVVEVPAPPLRAARARRGSGAGRPRRRTRR